MKKQISIVVISLLLSCNSIANEITDTEWLSNYLTITYYHETAMQVECTAYNSNKKPIGGGKGYFTAKVAKVIIDVPSKYAGKKLQLDCTPK